MAFKGYNTIQELLEKDRTTRTEKLSKYGKQLNTA
jgi:hypothetical protein